MDSDTAISSHDFSIKKLEGSCKLLCRDMGCTTVSAPALSKLTAILRSKMQDYSEGTRMMMENASRTKPIVTDVVAALKLKGVKMEEIVEYAKSVKSERLCSLPIYPAPDPEASSSDAAYFQSMYGPPPSDQELQHRPDHIPPYSRAVLSEFDMEKVKKEENAPTPSPQSFKKRKAKKQTSVFPNLEHMDFEQSGLYKVYEENRRWMELQEKKENAAPLVEHVQKPVPPAPTVVKPAAPPPVRPVAQPGPPPPETRAPLKIKVSLPPTVPVPSSVSYSSPRLPAVPPMAPVPTPLSPLVPSVPPKPTATVPTAPKPAVPTPNILKRRGRPSKVEKNPPSAQKQEPVHSKVMGFLKKDLGRSLFSSSSIVAAPVFTSSNFSSSSSKNILSSSSCPPKKPELLETSGNKEPVFTSSSSSKDVPSSSCDPPMEASSKDVPSSCPPMESELLKSSTNGDKEKKPKRDRNSEEYKEYKRQKKERKRREKEERRQRESQAPEPKADQPPMPKLKLRIKFGNDNLPTSSSFVSEPERQPIPQPKSPEVRTPLRLRIKFDGSKKEEQKPEEPKKAPAPIRRLISSDTEEEDEEVLYICPVCSVAYNQAANMVSCDKCEEWFHWHCVGITSEPTEEHWFCKKCSKSIKKSKKRAAGGAATSDLPAKRKKR